MSSMTTFTFRVSLDDRRRIAILAKWFERSESDALRYLVRKTTDEIDTLSKSTSEQKKACDLEPSKIKVIADS